jgi:diguanylate cyclase (GGDEF)-like protein
VDKEFRRSLTTTFVILVVIIMLIATFCMGVGLTAKSTGAIGKVTDDYMLSVARSASGLIDGDELAGLDYGCEGSPSYLKIRDTLSCFNENTGLEDIYILRPESGVGFIFVMDLTDEHPAQFEDLVEKPTDALRTAAQGTDTVDDKPYEDAWGRFYSAYSPVLDSEGNVAGIVTVDFDANWYDEQINSISKDVFYMGSVSLIMGAAVVVVMTAATRRNLRRAHSQLNELSDNIEELIVGIGNLSHADLNKEPKTKVKMLYEDDGLEALGTKIAGMQAALREQISHIQENAYIDVLTGAKNRNSYLEDVNIADPAIKAGNLSFSVAVFDVTGLKTINDTLGHECGDKAIMDTARVLTEAFGRDNTYRIGGDEFVAAVRFATSTDMKNSFKKIESLLAEINKQGGQYEVMPLVVSGGYAEFDPETDREFQDTFKRADRMMYQDKAEYYKKHDRRRR